MQDVDELLEEYRDLRAQNEKMRGALEAVEWVQIGDKRICPWCHAEYGYYARMFLQEFEGSKPQHKPDCLRQEALK